MTCKRLQQEMDYDEFLEHLADYELDPWGDDWQQAGTIAAAVYNANRGKGSQPIKPDRFIPRIGPVQVQSGAQIKAAIVGHARRHNERLAKQ